MDAEVDLRARIPADVDAPDKLFYGLTARQVAIFATAGVAGYLIWQAVGARAPLPVTAALWIPITTVAVVLALGRREGLSLDAWLLAALAHRRAPRRSVPAGD